MSSHDTMMTPDGTTPGRERRQRRDRVLRMVTGWALVVGAFGILVDSYAGAFLSADSPAWLLTVMAPGGLDQGTIGLIPAYLGVTVGLLGLVMTAVRVAGPWVAAVTAMGTAGLFTFWYSYPERATAGGLGALALGLALLLYPGWGRAASPFWVAGGMLGIPELVVPGSTWGPIAGFPLLGVAAGITGVYVLRAASRPATVSGGREPVHGGRAPVSGAGAW